MSRGGGLYSDYSDLLASRGRRYAYATKSIRLHADPRHAGVTDAAHDALQRCGALGSLAVGSTLTLCLGIVYFLFKSLLIMNHILLHTGLVYNVIIILLQWHCRVVLLALTLD